MSKLESIPIKACACCGNHYTLKDWLRLTCLGWMGGFEEKIEVRLCECGNSLSISTPNYPYLKD